MTPDLERLSTCSNEWLKGQRHRASLRLADARQGFVESQRSQNLIDIAKARIELGRAIAVAAEWGVRV